MSAMRTVVMACDFSLSARMYVSRVAAICGGLSLSCIRGSGVPREEAASRDERFETRIRSVGVPLWIDLQQREVNIVGGGRRFEPGEHFLAIAEAGVHQRHRVRRHVALVRHPFDLLKYVSSFVRLPGLGQQVSPQ